LIEDVSRGGDDENQIGRRTRIKVLRGDVERTLRLLGRGSVQELKYIV
jgi:hypothetical protein